MAAVHLPHSAFKLNSHARGASFASVWAANYKPQQPGTILRLPEGERRHLHPGREEAQ